MTAIGGAVQPGPAGLGGDNAPRRVAPASSEKVGTRERIGPRRLYLKEGSMPANDPTPTRPSLLLRIRDAGDRSAWEQFVGQYAPMIYRFALRRGLQDADAADVTQEVLRTVAAKAGRLEYDPAVGSFRAWLFTVTRNTLINVQKSESRSPRGTGDTAMQDRLDAQPAPTADEAAAWEQEYRQRRLAWAAERVRGHCEESTWQAFWRTAIQGEAPRSVAQSLGLSVGAVHIAKSRVIARLKAVLGELSDE
jgi:RNA polymerase sigma-70 factor (ECF subfamily)